MPGFLIQVALCKNKKGDLDEVFYCTSPWIFLTHLYVMLCKSWKEFQIFGLHIKYSNVITVVDIQVLVVQIVVFKVEKI